MILNLPRSYPNLRAIFVQGLGIISLANPIPEPKVESRSQTSYTPVAFGLGTAPVIDNLQPYSGTSVTLDSSTPVLTLDYAADVAGFPYFEVTSLTGSATQIELKYSEQFNGLKLYSGDGPWYLLPTILAVYDMSYS